MLFIKAIDTEGNIKTVEQHEKLVYVKKQRNGIPVVLQDDTLAYCAEGILSSTGAGFYQLENRPILECGLCTAVFISSTEYYELLEQLNKSEEDENSSSEDTNEGE